MNHRLPVHAYEVGCVVHDGLVSSAPLHRACQWVQSEVPRNPVYAPRSLMVRDPLHTQLRSRPRSRARRWPQDPVPKSPTRSTVHPP